MTQLCGLVIGFLVFGAYALWRVPRDYRAAGTLSGTAVGAVWAAYLLHAAAVVYAVWQPLGRVPLDRSLARTIGGGLLLIGVSLTVVAVIQFGSVQRLSGREIAVLVKAGVYRWSRNPQNLGWAITLLGIAVVGMSLVSALLVALFACAIHLHIVVVEERHLENVFGGEYRAYRETVARYLGRPSRSQRSLEAWPRRSASR
jgi:protein-S-isoprenylcysteine O-methyltransferase Ste14